MQKFISEYICCCLQQPQPQIIPEENKINVTQVDLSPTKDQFLDSNDPIAAICKSQQIEKVTSATVNAFLSSKNQIYNPYVSGDKEDMIKYEKVVSDCRKQNPESVTNLLKDLINILPKKKSTISHKRPKKEKNSNVQTIYTQYSTNSKIRQKSSIETKSIIKSIAQTDAKSSKTQSSIKKRELETVKITIRQKNKNNQRYQKQQKNSIISEKSRLKTEKVIDSGEREKKINQEQKKRPQNFIYQQDDLQEVKQHVQQILRPNMQEQNNKNQFSQQISNQQKYYNIIKAFVFLYTSPYIYKQMNQAFTQEKYQNYAKIVAFVTDALQKLPKIYKQQISVKFTSGISLYRGIPQKNVHLPKQGYWKAFTSTSLDRRVAQQFEDGKGSLIEIRLKPPMTHMHIKVPNNSNFSFFNENQVILFPFFHFEVIKKSKNMIILKEVKQNQLKKSG